jgi:hypothetical protein
MQRGGDQVTDVVDIGAERGMVDRPVEARVRGQAPEAQPRHHLPMPAWRVVMQPRPAWTAAIAPHEIGGHATCIQEHVGAQIVKRLRVAPAPSAFMPVSQSANTRVRKSSEYAAMDPPRAEVPRPRTRYKRQTL